jgi:hypothetical protein
MLSVIYAECHMEASFTVCRYAECCYAKCRGTSLLSIIIYDRNIFKVQSHDRTCWWAFTKPSQELLVKILRVIF